MSAQGPRRWLTPALALGAGALALALVAERAGRPAAAVRFSAGDREGHRHTLAEALGVALDPARASLRLHPTGGSEATLDGLEAGTLDAALVQGGLGPRPGVCQLAPVAVEPLHVLVQPALLDGGLPGLRGRRINLSTADSGTRAVAADVLAFAGLRAGDWVDLAHPYDVLLTLPAHQRPDAIATVSPLPSELVSALISAQGYRLLPLHFGAGLHLHRPALHPTEIPTGSYGLHPEPEPARPLPTLGPRLLLVARCDLDDRAVHALLEGVHAPAFTAALGQAPIPESAYRRLPEHPVHPAALAWMGRDDPAWTGEDVETLENLRSLLGSCGVAAFFGWSWLRRRRLERMERYLKGVSELEEEVAAVEAQPGHLDVEALVRLRHRLGGLKAEAIRRHAEGELEGAEVLGAFLAQVTDARHHLNALILHERERQEEEELARTHPAYPASAEPLTGPPDPSSE